MNIGAKVLTTGADVAGKAVVGLSYLLSKIVAAEYKTKGIVPKKYFNGKPTAYFTIMRKDLLEFSRAAKQYGIAYSVVMDKSNTNPKAEVDILIQDSNAALVQRVMERYGFNMPDINLDEAAAARDNEKTADVENSEYYIPPEDFNVDADAKDVELAEDEPASNGQHTAEKDQTTVSQEKVPDIDILRSDAFINLLEEQQVDINTKDDNDSGKDKRPTQARTENQNIQFAHSSKTITSKEKPSVKGTLMAHRKEEKREAAQRSPTRVRGGYEHVQTLARKPKSKEGKER